MGCSLRYLLKELISTSEDVIVINTQYKERAEKLLQANASRYEIMDFIEELYEDSILVKTISS